MKSWSYFIFFENYFIFLINKNLFYYDTPHFISGYTFCLKVFFCLMFDIAARTCFWLIFVLNSFSAAFFDSRSPIWLQSMCWLQLQSSQGSTRGVTFWEFFADCWPETLVPCHMGFSIRAAWNMASELSSHALLLDCSGGSHLLCCELSQRNEAF